MRQVGAERQKPPGVQLDRFTFSPFTLISYGVFCILAHAVQPASKQWGLTLIEASLTNIATPRGEAVLLQTTLFLIHEDEAVHFVGPYMEKVHPNIIKILYSYRLYVYLQILVQHTL